MRKRILNLCQSVIVTLCCSSSALLADNPVAPSLKNIDCSTNELMSFFPKTVVEVVLLQAKFSPEDAKTIAGELSKKNPELASLVEKKASKMNPNPFIDLSQRDQGLKIYRETLYEVFSKVLKEHGVADEVTVQGLLEDIRETKSKLFIECIRKQQTTSNTPSTPSTSPTENEAPDLSARQA